MTMKENIETIENYCGKYIKGYAKIYLDIPELKELSHKLNKRKNVNGKKVKMNEAKNQIIEEFNKYYRFNYL